MRRFAAALVFCAVPLGPVDAEMPHQMAGLLRIEQAWTRATPAGAATGGGYLTITNTGTEDDRLVAVSTARAGRTEVHEMALVDGVMTMRRLLEGLPLPAGETVELRPGGLHLMFRELAGGIAEGETVSVTLTFEKAGTVRVEMPAAPIGARAPAMDRSGED